MNRRIKFRIWDNFSKVFAYTDNVYIQAENGNRYLDGKKKLWINLKFSNQILPEVKEIKPNFSETYTIQQFTGMKDTTGKEVYEGDILCEKMDSETAAQGGEAHIGQVIFYSGHFAIDGGGSLYDHTFSHSPDVLQDYLVIGNIFENPELLK